MLFKTFRYKFMLFCPFRIKYLLHTISVQSLLLDRTTLDCLVRSTAMRRTPPNASEHRRNSTGCLEMTYLPSDAGKITLISYLFSVLSSLLLNWKCLFLLNYLLYFFTLFNDSFFRHFLRRLSGGVGSSISSSFVHRLRLHCRIA